MASRPRAVSLPPAERVEPASIELAGRPDRPRPDEAPLVPEGAVCFAPVAAVDPVALAAEFEQALAELRRLSEPDPFSNPIQLLAVRIMSRLDSGELSLSALEQLIQHLTTESFRRRAERLRRYLGEGDPGANIARLKQLLLDLTREAEGGAPVPFERFRGQIERERFGVVITAHPTFSLARALQEVLVELALNSGGDGSPDGGAPRRRLLDRVSRSEHRPDQPLDLVEEHRQSLAAIGNLQAVLSLVYRLVFEVAAEVYPERWTELEPAPSDHRKLGRLRPRRPLRHSLDDDLRQAVAPAGSAARTPPRRGAPPARRPRGHLGVADLLELLEARLALAIKQAEDEIAVFEEPAGEARAWRRQLARAARTMHEGRERPPDRRLAPDRAARSARSA